MSFAIGQRVRITARDHEGHHRTPGYLKGKTGVIERAHGFFTNPETRAYGRDGLPGRELYLVALDTETKDRVFVDVFDHWLESAE